jgi:hypothetical protein
MASVARISDGQTSFEGGVDSGKTPTIATEATPTGLKRNQLAWAFNASMRGGGVGCRTGFRKIELDFGGDQSLQDAFELGLFQGASMYDPDAGFPYIVASISGRFFIIHTDSDNTVVEITIPGDPNPATERHAWFCQAEEFLVIQDGVSVPLVWNGAVLQRVTAMLAAPVVPIGTCMDYYMGRLWVCTGQREYVAGDIVGGPNGTAPYDFRDSVLKFLENAYLAGGGAFRVPAHAGDIVALRHTANLDTSLGEGQLFVFTRTMVFATAVPVTRAAWQATTEPLQRVAQIKYGATSQESVVHVNGDLFYRAPDGIRSLFMSIRNFGQWGNLPISSNVNRVVQREDRSLHRYASAIEFDNKMWQLCYPVNTNQGATFNGILMLDYDLISNMQEKVAPAWEGMVSGLNFLRILEADYGGEDRAFTLALQGGSIECWEITTSDRWDNIDGRIQWAFETPAYNWGTPFTLKKLMGLELWIDKLFGPVDFEVWYRPDQYPCWQQWHTWQECVVRNPCEDPDEPDCYVMDNYRESYRATVNLPQPPDTCTGSSRRPFRFGYQFQVMVRITGWCRIRGLIVHAEPIQTQNYENIVC